MMWFIGLFEATQMLTLFHKLIRFFKTLNIFSSYCISGVLKRNFILLFLFKSLTALDTAVHESKTS